MASAQKADASMNAIDKNLRSSVTYTFLVLFLALFGAALRPGGYQPKAQKPPRDPMVLLASPNDPLMIEAIKIARSVAAQKSGANAWSRPKSDGPVATLSTYGGSISLSRKEIADANFIYPQLRERAKESARKSTARRVHAGYTNDEDGE